HSYSSNPTPAQAQVPDKNVNVYTLPTPADNTNETEVKKLSYTDKASEFSFDYPLDWESTASALILPDTDMGQPIETALVTDPTQKKLVLMQEFNAPSGLETKALFSCSNNPKCKSVKINEISYT